MGGANGRGNLRENREDPAPTVGIAIRIAPKGRPLPPPSCAYHATHGDPGFYNDAARHVATNALCAQSDATNGPCAGLPIRGGGAAGRPAAQEAAETARRPGAPPPPAGGHLLRAATAMRVGGGVCSDVARRVAI